ncbi:MAG: PilZ domain-containing protein [Candidatus Omnitrophica bacterium]|nr:PilZ domain-containing protein [Candidatus Omnitrophota bacterium]
MESFQERRKYMRLKTSVQVKYTIIGNPGEIEVFSKDVSAGGICMYLGEELVADTPLQLEIVIPDLKDPIHALGRVVWQKKDKGQEEQVKLETGIEFTGISDFDRFNINRYVQGKTE